MFLRVSCLALSAVLLSTTASAAPAPNHAAPAAMQRVDGNNVGRVRHSGGGAFVETRPGRWVEFADDGTLIHRFDETNRSRDAVNLYDPSRGARVRLDLRRGDISGVPRSGPPRFLYRITDVDPRRSSGWGDNGGWGEGGWGRPGGGRPGGGGWDRPGGGGWDRPGGGGWDRPGGGRPGDGRPGDGRPGDGGGWGTGGVIRDIEVGPLWNQSDADRKCRDTARDMRGEWTGNWRTTVQGRQSVCSIRFQR
ncbi:MULTISPECIES: mannan-binding lectin [unclassified Sphingomonas]|nr:MULTISPECIES: mannan-binding lectin [unclassified Sphingomonas]